MECLKFELFTPCATFKTPFSLKGIETYPLPPFSTVRGLLYTALGRGWEGEEFNLSIQGKYESIFRDYIRFRKYNRKDRELENLPLEVPRLYNLWVLVHVLANKELLEEFKTALERPSYYLFLGEGEYPVLVKGVRPVHLREEKEGDIELKYSAYVPKDRVKGERGIFFRLASSYIKDKGERVHRWKEVYYFPSGNYLEGVFLFDEEGDIVWV